MFSKSKKKWKCRYNEIELQKPGAKRNQKYDLGSRSVLYPDVPRLKD